MFDEAASQRTFAHAMELWFEPEIRRRQEAGTISKPFTLRAAQVIMYADDRPNVVRLNEEVQLMVETKLRDGITKDYGEPLYWKDLETITSIRLPDDQDPNCGHFTLVRIGDAWYCAFDFRYNKAKAAELLEAAEEFFAAASDALDAGRKRVAVDNLFSAAELAAKAYVVSTPLPGDGQIEKHQHIHARFNMFARHGNVEADHRKAFNKLSEQRIKARYVRGDLELTIGEIADWKKDIQGLVESIRRRLRGS